VSNDIEVGMLEYYRNRAPVYDRVYAYPERQRDLRYLEELVSTRFEDLDVIEVAAGTGYWTQFIAAGARSVLATDLTEAAMAQMKDRQLSPTVRTRIADAYRLAGLDSTFNGAFGGLWFSHVPMEQRAIFFDSLHGVLSPGARIVLIDNSSVQCERLPITHVDERGNTFQDRVTDDGAVHRILKNFPTEAELRALTVSYEEVRYEALEHYWYLEYRIR